MKITPGKIIEDQWLQYSQAIWRGRNPGSIQVIETRQAFYSGAIALLHFQSEVIAKEPDDDLGAVMLESINRELIEFGEKTKRGDFHTPSHDG